MDEDRTPLVSGGIGFDGLLILIGIIFCILRGAEAIDWDWVYVCIPFMIIAAEIALAIFGGLMFGLIYAIMRYYQDRTDHGLGDE